MGGSIYTDKWNRTIYQYKFLSIKPFCCRQRKITSSRISMQWAQMTAVRANEVTNKKKKEVEDERMVLNVTGSSVHI